MPEKPDFIEIEDYDENEMAGFNSKLRGVAALKIKDDSNSRDEIKTKMENNTVASDLNISRENTPIEGFRNIEEKDGGLYAEVVFIQDLEPKKIVGKDFKRQRVHFPPDNIVTLRVKEYDETTVVYLFTGSDKKVKKIQSYIETFFSSVERMKPGKEVVVDSIFENKSQVYELQVDPDIVKQANIEGDTEEVQIQGNSVKGSKGLLVLDDQPVIKNLGLDRDSPPLVEKVKTREWVHGNEDTSTELTHEGQVKVHFPVTHFDSSYAERDLFDILIDLFEQKITDKVL